MLPVHVNEIKNNPLDKVGNQAKPKQDDDHNLPQLPSDFPGTEKEKP